MVQTYTICSGRIAHAHYMNNGVMVKSVRPCLSDAGGQYETDMQQIGALL